MTYRRVFKPLLDRFLAVGLGLLGLPVIALIACVVRLRIGAPVLFRQPRIGFREQGFDLLKFRSMTDARDASGTLLPDSKRLMPLGAFLRAASLDEIPQLWNVVKGDMSLIGPRPLLPQYLPRYSARQRRRHELKPGITGWTQVRGRNSLTWEERFELDIWYVDHCSAVLDMKILCMTVIAVMSRKGISERGHATSSEFLGSSPD